MRWLWVLGVLASGIATAAEVEVDILFLCRSADVEARRVCLRQIRKSGDRRDVVKNEVARMAAKDPILAGEAAELLQSMLEETPPAPAPVAQASSGDAGDITRAILAPTAFVRPKGDVAVNAFELGTYQIDYGVSEGFQIGAQTAIPIGFLPIGVTAKVSYKFDGGAIGLWGDALAIFPFQFEPVFVFGGGPVVTFGTPDAYFGGGALLFHLTGTESGSGTALVPYIGGSLRVSERVRFGVEVFAPLTLGQSDSDALSFGKAIAVMWGVRIFGKDVWGDIAVVDPICEDCGEIYKVIPLGIPFLNVGFRL
jgi:hypothetical protein